MAYRFISVGYFLLFIYRLIMSIPKEVIDNLMSKVKVGSSDECWFTHYVGNRFSYKAKLYNLNSVLYFSVFKEMPKTLVSKTCNNQQCCNPNHLIFQSEDENSQAEYLLSNPSNFDSVFNEYTQDYCKVWKRLKVHGYARYKFQGKNYCLHRKVLELDGIDMTGLVARHLCNNPGCCKREHLDYGTHADNVMDKVLAGRSTAKLSKEQVLAIIELLKTTDLTLKEVSNKLDITYSRILAVSNGQSWRHLSNMPKGSKRSDWLKDNPKQLSLFD